MKKLLQGTVVGLVSLFALNVGAKCYWEDVVITYDQDCNVVSATKGGKKATGSDLERIMDRAKQRLSENNGKCGNDGGSMDGNSLEEGGGSSAQVEKVRKEIANMMLVTSEVAEGSQSKKYQNNINSVRENQNKIKLNAISRSIALGKRSVALALESGKDIDALRQEIETSNDMISLLKGIAKLQAQHLQKTNQITALRSKLLELNSIDAIIAGDIYSHAETSSDKN